jgi:hypothetical protein
MASNFRVELPAHAGSSLADFSTLKMEAIRSSETSVHTRSTRRHIPEDGILLTESFLYRISTKSVKPFGGYMEKYIFGLSQN